MPFVAGTCGICGSQDKPWADKDRMLCSECSPNVHLVFRCPCGVGLLSGTYDQIVQFGVGGLLQVTCRGCEGPATKFILESRS